MLGLQEVCTLLCTSKATAACLSQHMQGQMQLKPVAGEEWKTAAVPGVRSPATEAQVGVLYDTVEQPFSRLEDPAFSIKDHSRAVGHVSFAD